MAGATPNAPLNSNTLSFDEVASIVGDLYLKTHLRIAALQNNTAPLLRSFQEQIAALTAENANLKAKLEGKDTGIWKHGNENTTSQE